MRYKPLSNKTVISNGRGLFVIFRSVRINMSDRSLLTFRDSISEALTQSGFI